MTPKLRIVSTGDRSHVAAAALLRERRLARGNTQAQEARLYGVGERTYRRWEYGQGDFRMLLGFAADGRRAA